MAADMTRRNELSGGTPVVREFEKEWREWIGSKFALTTVNVHRRCSRPISGLASALATK